MKMPGLPDDMLRAITVQVITAMALSTAPLDASADDALPPAAPPQLQQPEIQQVDAATLLSVPIIPDLRESVELHAPVPSALRQGME